MPDASETIASRWLAKVFTTEFVVSAAITLFIAGSAWNSLQSSIALAQSRADDSAEKVAAVGNAVAAMQTDVEVIKTRLESASGLQRQQTRELIAQREDIKKILTLLVEKKGGE